MKTGRNAPCACGSGKKVKNCCGSIRTQHHPAPPLEEDRRWVEKHILKEGDLLLYGILLEDLGSGLAETPWKAFRGIAERYLAAGPAGTTLIHAEVDALIESLIQRDQRFGYPPPFCHRGCASCCHELVYCTAEEAAGIQDYCQARGLEIDYDKASRQLAHVAVDSRGDHTGATTWNEQALADQSCLFLDPAEKSCRIWPVRPLVCRVHLAEETDRYCAPHNGVENPEARGINYVELATILTVVFTLHRDSIKRTLGRLLLDARQAGPGQDATDTLPLIP